MHRLRRQPEMTEHRNVGARDRFDHRQNAFAALELDRLGAAFLQQPAGVAHRRARRNLERHERQIGDDEGPRLRSHHGARVVQHVRHRHRQRAVVPEHHHAERITDQDHIDTGTVGQPRERMIVGRHHDDATALTLHVAQRRDRHLRCRRRCRRHRRLCSAGLATAGARCVSQALDSSAAPPSQRSRDGV
jgi:hypothetical protein